MCLKHAFVSKGYDETDLEWVLEIYLELVRPAD